MDGTVDDDIVFEPEDGSHYEDMAEFEDYAVNEEDSVEEMDGLAGDTYNVRIGWMLCFVLVGFSCVSHR